MMYCNLHMSNSETAAFFRFNWYKLEITYWLSKSCCEQLQCWQVFFPIITKSKKPKARKFTQ